jgi:hypothetical protein
LLLRHISDESIEDEMFGPRQQHPPELPACGGRVREREKQEKMEQSTSWRSNSERRKAVAAEPGEVRRDVESEMAPREDSS